MALNAPNTFRLARAPLMAASVTRSRNRKHAPPPPIRKRGLPNWQEDEDTRLRLATQVRPELTWDQIAQVVSSRESVACQRRASRLGLLSAHTGRRVGAIRGAAAPTPTPTPTSTPAPAVKRKARPALAPAPLIGRLNEAAGFDGLPVEPLLFETAPPLQRDVGSFEGFNLVSLDALPDLDELSPPPQPQPPPAPPPPPPPAPSRFVVSFREPPVADPSAEGPIEEMARTALSCVLLGPGRGRSLSLSYQDLWGRTPHVPHKSPAPRLTDYWTKRRPIPGLTPAPPHPKPSTMTPESESTSASGSTPPTPSTPSTPPTPTRPRTGLPSAA